MKTPSLASRYQSGALYCERESHVGENCPGNGAVMARAMRKAGPNADNPAPPATAAFRKFLREQFLVMKFPSQWLRMRPLKYLTSSSCANRFWPHLFILAPDSDYEVESAGRRVLLLALHQVGVLGCDEH